MISDKLKAFVRWFSTVNVRVVLAATITIIALMLLTVVLLFLVGVFKFGADVTVTTSTAATLAIPAEAAASVATPIATVSTSTLTTPTFTQIAVKPATKTTFTAATIAISAEAAASVATPIATVSTSTPTTPTFTQIAVKPALLEADDSKPSAANEKLQRKIAQPLENEQMKASSVEASMRGNATHVNVSVTSSRTTVNTMTVQPVPRLNVDDAFLANPTINESTVKAMKERYHEIYRRDLSQLSYDSHQYSNYRNIKRVTVLKPHAGFMATLQITLDAKQGIYEEKMILIHGTQRWGDKEVVGLIFDLSRAFVYAYDLGKFHSFYDCENFLFGAGYGSGFFPSEQVGDHATTIFASLKQNEEFVEMTHFEELRDDQGRILLGWNNKTEKSISKLSTRSWANLFNYSKSVRFENFYGFLKIEDDGKVGKMSVFNSWMVDKNRTVASMGDKRYSYACKQMNASEMKIKIPWTPNESCAIEPRESTDTIMLYETRESRDSYLRLTSSLYSKEFEFFPKRKIISTKRLDDFKFIYDGVKSDAPSVTIYVLSNYELQVNLSAPMMKCFQYKRYYRQNPTGFLEISQHTVAFTIEDAKIVLNGSTISFWQYRDDVKVWELQIPLDVFKKLKNKDFKWSNTSKWGKVEISRSNLVAIYGKVNLTLTYASGSIQINELAIKSGDKLAVKCDSAIMVARFDSAMFPLNMWSVKTSAEESLKVDEEEQNNFDPILVKYINSLESNELLQMHSDWVNISMNATSKRIAIQNGVISLKKGRAAAR